MSKISIKFRTSYLIKKYNKYSDRDTCIKILIKKQKVMIKVTNVSIKKIKSIIINIEVVNYVYKTKELIK